MVKKRGEGRGEEAGKGRRGERGAIEEVACAGLAPGAAVRPALGGVEISFRVELRDSSPGTKG